VSEAQAVRFYDTIERDAYVPYFEPMRKAHYRQALSPLAGAPGSRLLDVGASYGWMVEVGLDLGFDAYGVEPGDAPPTSPLAAERIVRSTVGEFASRADQRYDVVTIWHVLEHLPEPNAAVAEMRALMSDTGLLLVAIPNAEGWMYRLGLFLRRAFGIRTLMTELYYFHNPNPHFFYYGPKALRSLLERNGLRVERMYTMDAFDWNSIYKRIHQPVLRQLARLAGPLVAASRFTARENLVAVASLARK
jgi:SAM-dependent methyltransferase